MAVVTTDFTSGVIDMVNSLTTTDKANLNDALYKSIFQDSNFAQSRNIVAGIRNGSKVFELDGTPNYGAFPLAEDCAPNSCDVNINGTNFNWDVANYGCDVEICLKTFDQNFLKFFNTWKTDNDENGLESALVQYLFEEFQKTANASLWTKSLVAEKGSSNNVLDGSNGHLVLAEAGGGEVIELTENETGSEVITYADPNTVKAYLDQVYEAFLGSNFYDKDVVIEMDKRTAMAYIQWLDANDKKAAGCCVDIEKVMQFRRAFTGLNFKGIPIEVRGEYDQISATVLDGAKPHFILLAEKSKLMVGTEQIEKMAELDIWYERKPNVIIMRGELNLGSALPTNDYILVY